MLRKVKFLVAQIPVLLLMSCSYNPFIANNHTTGSATGALVGAGVGAGTVAAVGGTRPLIALGGITGGMFGYYVTTLRYDSGPILKAGGNVYKIGDYVGIDLPSDILFIPNTDEFLPQAVPVLDSAAVVLQRYPNNNIMVSGNTSGFYRAPWEQRLSEKRAQAISAYLWNAGINNFKTPNNDLRKLNYVGYGSFFPISNDYTNDGIRANSHIQIVSYPSTCDLMIDKRNMALNNMGATTDQAIYDAPALRCRDTNAKGECIGVDP